MYNGFSPGLRVTYGINVTILSTSFAESAGCVRLKDNNNVFMSDCTFFACSNLQIDGGGLYVSFSKIAVIQRCSFKSCEGGDGGALSVDNTYNLLLVDSMIEGGNASVAGGCMYLWVFHAVVRNVIARYCSSISSGAGVYVRSDDYQIGMATLLFDNFTISECSTSYSGLGAGLTIYAINQSFKITMNNVHIRNTSTLYRAGCMSALTDSGGIIYLRMRDVTLDKCVTLRGKESIKHKYIGFSQRKCTTLITTDMDLHNTTRTSTFSTSLTHTLSNTFAEKKEGLMHAYVRSKVPISGWHS
jgi:hypothetical protein